MKISVRSGLSKSSLMRSLSLHYAPAIILLAAAQSASSQVVTQSFTGVVYTSSGGPGLFGTPAGEQVSGTFTVNTANLGIPVSVAVGNEWGQQLNQFGLKGITPNNSDSISATSAHGFFTASNLQSVILGQTYRADLQYGGGALATGPAGGLAILCLPSPPSVLPITIDALPLSIPSGCTAQVDFNDNLNQYFIEINLTNLSSKGCAANVTLHPGFLQQMPYMAAQFIAPNSTTVSAYAQSCGFDYIDWQQIVTTQPAVNDPAPRVPSALQNNVSPSVCSNLQSVPIGAAKGTLPVGWSEYHCTLFATPSNNFYDPPYGDYSYTPPDSASYNSYPFYYPLTGGTCTSINPANCPPLGNFPPILSPGGDILWFVDAPANKAFSGKDTPVAPYISFYTTLVGVSIAPLSGSSPCGPLSLYNCTPLFHFSWVSTFTGTAGGVFQQGLVNPIDPGSGTGGVTITNINGVQLPTAVSSDQVATTASGLSYSRVTRTLDGTLTIQNMSGNVINGPIQILFAGTPNVTLMNATGNLSGTPYMTVPGLSSLAPGQSVTVPLQFSNPTNATITVTPAIYSGSIN